MNWPTSSCLKNSTSMILTMFKTLETRSMPLADISSTNTAFYLS
ncbi:hypothetical protein MYA_0372 [Burkholderia sp. KJ006]|nr:hypothetical protein MYA_0372 [Burkholderia sp. KJ006]